MNITIKTLTPATFKQYVQKNPLSCTYYHTAAGVIQITLTDLGVCRALYITDQKVVDTLDKSSFSNITDLTNLILVGTNFQQKVWQATAKIPAGKTITYQELAYSIGHPHAWRAVANALATNKIAYFIPCHRVIRKNGDLGGYHWGLARKRALLESEGALER